MSQPVYAFSWVDQSWPELINLGKCFEKEETLALTLIFLFSLEYIQSPSDFLANITTFLHYYRGKHLKYKKMRGLWDDSAEKKSLLPSMMVVVLSPEPTYS